VSKVLVANLSAPELGYLAAALAGRGQLLAYVRRYAHQDRWWERAMARLGGDRAIAHSIGRRKLVDGLRREHVVEAGVACDFAAALVARLGAIGVPASVARDYGMQLHHMAATRISRTAGRLAHAADMVVAGAGMAEEAFRALRRAGRSRARILNVSSVHHRVQRRLVDEMGPRLPEFSTLSEDSEETAPELQRRYERELDLADLIFTGSSFAKASFVAEGVPEGKLRVVPYGVDLARFNAHGRDLNSDTFGVLYVGRISLRKGVGFLLKAYEKFRKPNSTLTLVGSVVGDRACLTPYEAFVTCSPPVPQIGLPAAYRAAGVFVFPSLYEGMGLVVLEAMACGCPVIVSDHGPSEVVRDGVDGFVVPAGDSDAIANALEKLYVDPDLRRRMSWSAREQAARYSWDCYARTAADDTLTMASPAGQAA
jgi:glycosyltransferase involved in cell wall biosynthesis